MNIYEIDRDPRPNKPLKRKMDPKPNEPLKDPRPSESLKRKMNAEDLDQDVVEIIKHCNPLSEFYKELLRHILDSRSLYRKHGKYSTFWNKCEKNHKVCESLKYEVENNKFHTKLDLTDSEKTCFQWYCHGADEFIKNQENISSLLSGIAFVGNAIDIVACGGEKAFFYAIPLTWDKYKMIVKRCEFIKDAKSAIAPLEFNKDEDLFQEFYSGLDNFKEFVEARANIRKLENYEIAEKSGFFYSQYERLHLITPSYDIFDASVSTPPTLETCAQWYTYGTDLFVSSSQNLDDLKSSIIFFTTGSQLRDGVKNFFFTVPVSFEMYSLIVRLCKFEKEGKKMGVCSL